MPQNHQETSQSRVLHELAREEQALDAAFEALKLAQSEVEMAARKYAAVRSLATDILGYSPYHDDAVWGAEESKIVPAERRGRYRFLQMKPREAILEALAEQDADISLKDIEERLKTGGLDLGSRAINAALMRLSGVEKTSQGTYRLKVRRSRAA